MEAKRLVEIVMSMWILARPVFLSCCVGLWDNFHYSPLVRIVNKFGAADPELEAWIKNYKKDLKAYTIVASIEDYIESDLDTCTDQSQEDRAKHDPHYNCPVEWKAKFVDHSLQHLTDVWEVFSDRYLVPDSPPTALLDRVRKGCVSVTWLVPSYLIPQLVERVKMDAKFFQIFRILKVTVRDKTVYEETTDVSSKYAQSCKSNLTPVFGRSFNVLENTCVTEL